MAIDCTSDPEVVQGSSGKLEHGGGGGGNGGGIDAKERHKLAERERRKSMTQLFSSLHSFTTTSSVLSNSKFSSLPAFQGSDIKKNKATSAASTITSACDIRIAPVPSSLVAIRVRGDRFNVNLVLMAVFNLGVNS
ncbi:hypothetical protein MKX03_007597, partial [Papaver bracteatum]